MAKSSKNATSKKSATAKPTQKEPALPKAPEKTAAKLPVTATATLSPAKKTVSTTGDANRLARNARLREWRATHAAEQRTYMAEWRAKRKAKTASTRPSSGSPATPATATTSAEKGGGA